MLKYISTNKYEYSVRQVDILSNMILEAEKKLENTEGFLNRFKVRRELKKLNNKILVFGEEVLEYEANLN